jgi:CelD/BcsL family acetyltransferase involved in cellulose biosynthesis
MAHLTRAAFDERADVAILDRIDTIKSHADDLSVDVRVSLHHNIADLESEWRALEVQADGTAFQTFDWLSAWQRHIGAREGVIPAIVVGRHRQQILFILPLALQPGILRRVVWLGDFLNNSNAPLLARNFSEVISPTQFLLLWRQVVRILRSELRHDLIDLSKLPETVGTQANPLLALQVTPHANDTYLTHLSGTWDEFYAAKRSSSWRKTDAKKRRRLAKFGEVEFATPDKAGDIEQTLDALIEQKKSLYASLGVGNLFDRPGYRDFFLDLASNPLCRGLVHVSSVKVGSMIVAASFGLMFHGNYDYVLAGYCGGELEACSPGTIHLQELMRYFLERGFKTFDFNLGDAPYKREWCDLELKLYDYVAPATAQGWSIAFVARQARALKRFAKRSPSIWPVVRRARSLIGKLRR